VILAGGPYPWKEWYIAELPSLVPFGAGTPGCSGVSTLIGKPFPRVNTANFTLTSTNAPPSSLGLVLFANAADVQGSDPFYAGVRLHVDLLASTDSAYVDAVSDAVGVGTAAAPIPNLPALVGHTYYAQGVWLWPASACTLAPFQLSTTAGLAITIHP
jgi:hypothetical protein